MDHLKYKRILLKISGEALQGSAGFGIDPKVVGYIAEEIEGILAAGIQIGIVIGGGNFFRGATLFKAGLERITADHIGILATMINALAYTIKSSR